MFKGLKIWCFNLFSSGIPVRPLFLCLFLLWLWYPSLFSFPRVYGLQLPLNLRSSDPNHTKSPQSGQTLFSFLQGQYYDLFWVTSLLIDLNHLSGILQKESVQSIFRTDEIQFCSTQEILTEWCLWTQHSHSYFKQQLKAIILEAWKRLRS